MNKMVNSSNFRNLVTYALILFFIGSFLFVRSFIGITIFGYRIGEIFIGLSLLSLLFSPIYLGTMDRWIQRSYWQLFRFCRALLAWYSYELIVKEVRLKLMRLLQNS